MKKIITVFLMLISGLTFSQTHGVFGGDAAASGYSNSSNTYGKWTKIGSMVLNGNWNRGSFIVDFFPKLNAHGDSRQTLIVNLGNSTTGVQVGANDIVLITHYGVAKSVLNAKVVLTSGAGVSNNNLSIWVQMGGSHISGIPIELRTVGNVSIHTTNQPYYSSIQESGTEYDLTSTYGMYGNNFGIGTTTPDEKLTVKGKIHAEEIKVDLSIPGPDYVFESDYHLRTLAETEQYILANKHLPEIPSAKEMEANGVELGEMNMLLLKKIEELTLYQIEVMKIINQQQKTIADQNSRIQQLESIKD